MTMFVTIASLGLTLAAGAWMLFAVLRGGVRRSRRDADQNEEILAKLSAVPQSCMDPALLTDGAGMILHASESAMAWLGYSAPRLQGTKLTDLAVSPDTLETSWRLMGVLGKKNHEFSIELKRGDGGTARVAAAVTRLSQAGGGLNLITLNRSDADGKKCLPCATGERLRALLEHASTAIYEADAQGRLTFFNGRFAELHGIQRWHRAPANLLELIHPEDREFVSALWRDAVQEVREFSTEHRILDGELGERWITLHAKPLRAHSGEIRMIGHAGDTTSVHQAVSAAREAASLKDSIVRSTPVPIMAFDTKARVTLWNPAAQALFGFTAEEVLGGANPVLGEEDHGEFERNFARSLAGEVLTGERVTRSTKDGRRIEISLFATPIRDEGGKTVGVAACLMDVTQQAAAEQELQMRAMELRRSQEIANLGSWNCDFTNRPDSEDGELKWSTQTYRIFGVEEGTFEVSMERFLAMVHPDDRQELLAAFRRAVTKGLEHQFDHRIIRPDGETRVVRQRGCIEKNADGKLLRIVGTVQDITEQRELEQRLAQADRMEGIGRLAGGVAHDFNNLLTVINGYCDLLLERDAQREADPRPIREIRKAGARAAELTNQLLTFSRRQVTQPRLIDMNAAAREAAGMLERLLGEDITLNLELADEPIRIWIDPTQFSQVLMNLAINARDAMKSGGRLAVRTRLSGHSEPPGLTADRSRNFATLEVDDTGEGIEASVLPHIFEPFFTTKGEGHGTGLGLSMVYGIVKQAGGEIHVNSEVGQGTRFTVYFPAGEEPDGIPYALTNRLSEITGGDETVLIVEDQPDVLEIASLALRGKGYRVLEAQAPGEAISICEGHEGRIHLILTDIVLPGMSGLEMSQVLAAKRPEAKLMFMSGYAREAVAERGVLPPDMEYMAKPFTIHEIQSRVRRVLDEAQTAAAGRGQ